MKRTLPNTAELVSLRDNLAKQFLAASLASVSGFASPPSTDINSASDSGFAQKYLLAHSALVDAFIIAYFKSIPALSSMTLMATGGYGRRELYPQSDIDLLILCPDVAKIDQQKNDIEAISTFLQNLWDAGLPVSHAVRTLSECQQWSDNDISVQTAILEIRWLSGDEALASALFKQTRQNLSVADFIYAKETEQQQRHQRYQNIDSSLEPNVKESPGALRELHMLRWIDRALMIQKATEVPPPFFSDWQRAQSDGWLAKEEAVDMKEGEAFLQKLRIHAHIHSKRAHDTILVDMQMPLAIAMGYRDYPTTGGVRSATLRPSEQMMKDYYRYAMQVLSLNQLIVGSIKAKLRQQTYGKKSTKLVKTKTLQYGLIVVDGLLDVATTKPLKSSPEHMLKPFLFRSISADIREMTPKLKRLLRSLRLRINETRTHPTLKADFLSILQLANGTITNLRELNRLGFLGEYIPAFGKIVGLMQHDLYHAYTVDQHTLMVIKNLRRLMLQEFSHEYPEHSQLVSEFPKPWRLIVAALFHDIAKGQGGNHSALGALAAEKFCQEHNIEKEDTALIVWLVKEHLSFSITAQQKDLSNPEVIENFKDLVQTPTRLNALFLLTTADMRGTSPKVWNQWKSNLLSTLHSRVRQLFLTNSQQESSEHINAITSANKSFIIKKEEVLNRLRMIGVDGERWWRILKDDYTHVFSASALSWHLRVLVQHQQKYKSVVPPMFCVAVRRAEFASNWELLLTVLDEFEGEVFSKVCGQLAHMGYSVMNARMAKWCKEERLYHFDVQTAQPSSTLDDARARMAVLEFTLKEQLMSEDILPPLVTCIPRNLRLSGYRPKAKLVLDETGARFILSVATLDRLGLLYDITQVLADWRARLHHAKINTLGNRAENVFVIECKALLSTTALVQFEKQLHGALAF